VSSVPLLGDWYLRSVRPSLLAARVLWIRTVIQLWLMFMVLTVIAEPGDGSLEPWVLLGGTSVVAAAAMVFVRGTIPRRVKSGTEPAALFSSLVTVLIAFASTPALVGLIGFFMGGGFLTYAVGLGVSHALLLVAIPSASLVERLQHHLCRLEYETDLHSAIVAK